MEALVSSHISASQDLHSGRSGFDGGSVRSSEDRVCSEVGFGRSAEVSVGGVPLGVRVSEDEPLGMLTMRCEVNPTTFETSSWLKGKCMAVGAK